MDVESLLAHVVKTAEDKVNEVLHSIVIPEVKLEILHEKQMQFDNMGANDWDSTPFPSLQESTIRKKRSKGSKRPTQALYDMGELESSLYMSSDDSDLEVHYSSPHGLYSEEWSKSKGDPHSFTKLTASEEEHVEELIEQGIERAFS